MRKAALKDPVAKIDEAIFKRLPGINCPAFNPHADITHEEIFQVDATTPCVVRMHVRIIFPGAPCENIGAPKRDIKFSVGVPLRARWRSSYLFDFFPGIANAGKRIFSLFLLLVKFPLSLQTRWSVPVNNEIRSLSGCRESEPTRQRLQGLF